MAVRVQDSLNELYAGVATFVEQPRPFPRPSSVSKLVANVSHEPPKPVQESDRHLKPRNGCIDCLPFSAVCSPQGWTHPHPA
eukprot:6195223-Pleurochrysis_carterae.AAC.2